MRTLRLALLCSLPLPALAEPPPEVVAAWQDIAAVQTLEARFDAVQTRKILSAPQPASGTLRFARPDQLAWQWTTPMRSTFVMRGSEIGMSYPDLGVQETIDLGTNPQMAGMVRGMMVWLTGDLALVERDFDATWRTDGATLVPKDPALAALFATLELEIGGSPASLTAFTLVEPDGDQLAVRLSDLVRDPVFGPDAFSLEAP